MNDEMKILMLDIGIPFGIRFFTLPSSFVIFDFVILLRHRQSQKAVDRLEHGLRYEGVKEQLHV
jgi:hypothetical protein